MKLKTVLILSAVTTPLFIVIMFLHGSSLRENAVTTSGIIDLEFARTVERAGQIYNAWKPDLVTLAMKNTGIDFLFLVSYAAFLFSSCFLLAKRYDGFWRRTGITIARLTIAAASFDMVENILLFRTLGGSFNKEVIAATYIFAGIKFILVGIAILYILSSLVGLLTGTKKRVVGLNDTNFS